MRLPIIPGGPRNEESPGLEPAGTALDSPAEFCPVCSQRLESSHCKMVCPRCGFFMSCSEFE